MHVRARREARKADEDYKNGVKKLENTRLALEERLEHGLRVWEKWEKERGGVVKTGELIGQTWDLHSSYSSQAVRGRHRQARTQAYGASKEHKFVDRGLPP